MKHLQKNENICRNFASRVVQICEQKYQKAGCLFFSKVGTPLLSSDPDILSREQLLYRLTATESVPFRIDGCSGQMRVAQESLNFEAQNKYNVTVTVTDNSNLEETATVTVLVQDINEPPHFKSPLIEKNIQETARNILKTCFSMFQHVFPLTVFWKGYTSQKKGDHITIS